MELQILLRKPGPTRMCKSSATQQRREAARFVCCRAKVDVLLPTEVRSDATRRPQQFVSPDDNRESGGRKEERSSRRAKCLENIAHVANEPDTFAYKVYDTVNPLSIPRLLNFAALMTFLAERGGAGRN